MRITVGSTNKSVYMYAVEDVGGTNPGEPKTGLLFSDIETGGSGSYIRQGAARVDITLITQTVAGVHADGGFVEVDATNSPGVYRFDPPDAAWVTGIDSVIIALVAAAANNCIFTPKEIDITDVDLRDAVRAGLTALPNAVVNAAGGLVTSAGGATGIDDLATPTNITAGTITTVTNNTDMRGTDGVDTATMRGTDGANTTTPPTAVQNRQEMDANSTQLAALIVGVNITSISGSSDAADNLEASTKNIFESTVTGSPDTVSIVDSALGAIFTTDGILIDSQIIFGPTGTANGSKKDITAYDAGLNKITFDAVANAPTIGDPYIIV